MLEITFSESACGSLKLAQHYGHGPYPSAYIGVIVTHADGSKPTPAEIQAAQQEAEVQARSAWENAVPMGGNPADVYTFGLAWNIGSIGQAEPWSERQQVLTQLYSVYPGGEWPALAEAQVKTAAENLETVRSRAAAGEALRIWYSSSADELCGLYWLMAQLYHSGTQFGEISLVKLPEQEFDGENLHTGWGDIAPGQWPRYLPLQTSAPPALCQAYAEQWHRLQQENAPLRAVIGGQLCSVPASFYDGFIAQEIAAQPDCFLEAEVVGRVLGRFGVGDAWIALRIGEMISAGGLVAISNPNPDMPEYHRLLKKLPPNKTR